MANQPIATLDYPRPIRPFGFVLALAMALIEQFPIWRLPQAQWLWPVLGLIGILMFAETHGKVMGVFARWRTRFPGGIRLVKDLARTIVATQYEAILADNRGNSGAVYNRPADDRCLVIWEELREILVESLGVKEEGIAPASRLFGDLGAS